MSQRHGSAHPAADRPRGWHHTFLLLAMNGTPAFGVLFLGWSIPLVLLLYWLENLVNGLMWHAGVKRHERLTGMRGHFRSQFGVTANGSPVTRFASEQFITGIIFTLGHGVFLFVFAFLILDGSGLLQQLPWVLLLTSAAMFGVVQEVRSVQAGIEHRPFAWLRAEARMSNWNVIAMHMGVLLALVFLAIDEGGTVLALFFIGMKTLVDHARASARADRSWTLLPPEPSLRWGDEAYKDRLLREHREALAQLARDEEVCPLEERPAV